jgi:hypothetical protein
VASLSPNPAAGDWPTLRANHLAALEDGRLEGMILRFQRAAGFALHRIISVRPLVLEWIPGRTV